jgi:hypothetical protein
LAIELITKTFMPIGGRIMPSATTITMITPNQIGSKPSEVHDDLENNRHRQQDHRKLVHDRAEQDVHEQDQRQDAVRSDRQRRAGMSLKFCAACVMTSK